MSEMFENLQADDTSTDNSRSFEDISNATSDATPEELLKSARAEVEGKNESRTEARTTKNASEKQPTEAREEVSQEIEAEMIEELKMLKAMRGEQEYEIPEDAGFTIKIDGEEVVVPLAELRNNYSGKTAWDKKFSELDNERKEYMADRGQVERYVTEFAALAKGDNKLEALEYLAQLSGQDPLQFRRDVENQMFEKFSSRQNLSEAEIRNLQLQEENNFLLRQKESETQRQHQSQARREAEMRLNSIQETHGLSNEDLSEMYHEIVNSSNEPLNDNQIFERMEHKAVDNMAYRGAEYLIGKVNEELINESNLEAVKSLITENPDFTEEDFTDILTEAFGSTTKTKKVSSKAKAAAKSKTTKQTKISKEAKEYASFDDLI